MPEFIADTAGTVNGFSWDNLPPFVRGYIECLLFTETCSGISMVEWLDPENVEAVEQGQADGNIPTDAGFGDLHPDSLSAIMIDCADFQARASHLLAKAYECPNDTGGSPHYYDEVQAGRDFWYTRNGHGVGFWDRKQLEKGLHESFGSPRVDEPNWAEYASAREDTIGVRLTAICKEWGEVSVTWGDPDESSPTGYGFLYVQ